MIVLVSERADPAVRAASAETVICTEDHRSDAFVDMLKLLCFCLSTKKFADQWSFSSVSWSQAGHGWDIFSKGSFAPP